jgi:ClpP class serine protease
VKRPKPTSTEALALLGASPLALAPASVRELGASWGWDDEDDDDPGYELVGDLAVLRLRGVLLQRGCWWWPGYDTIEAAFTRALLDGRVRGVVLDCDSPGGMVAGLFDTVRRMRAAAEASGKLVVAVVNERCYSACYAVACVADAIVVPRTGGVGSVGVIGTMVSWAAALEAAGVDVRVIVSGAEKADGHPAQPLSDGAVAREQARVDQLAEVFFAWVTERRGFDPRPLEAGIRLGPEAVTAKLADRVGTLAELLDGTLSLEACCGPEAEDTEVNEVPVPPPGTDAFRGAAANHHRTNTMSLPAILAALGAADAPQALKAITDLNTLRAQVHALSGESDDAKALGSLHAMKRDAESAATLRAQVEAEKKAAAAKERAALLADAVAAMKLSPAEASQDGTPEGWTTGLSNEGLKAFVARAQSAPAPRPAQPPTGPAAATAARLTDEQATLADQLGVDRDAYAKALAAQG